MVKKLLSNIPQPDTICAIDASTNSLAFSIFHKGELEKFGKIRFTGNNTYEKIGDAARKTKVLFEIFKVDAIIIEQTIYANSPKTAANLAMSQGALLGAARIAGVKVVGSTSPMAWQNFIGNGRLTTEEKLKIFDGNPGKSRSWLKQQERNFRKSRTIKFVNINFDISVDDDDVADAIAIGYWAQKNWSKAFKY
jgi:Holliday junction resolvasome RuvABC endonuclease subunit